jgi:hypothetical protein
VESSPQPRPFAVEDLNGALSAFLSHSGTRLLVAQALVLAVLRTTLGKFRTGDAAVAGAVTAWWPFQEWFAHRLILHAPQRVIAGRTIDPAVARYHRAHHADPWNPDLALLPVRFLLPAVPVNILFWLLVAPTRRIAVSGMLATTLATVVYEWTHFLTHTSHRPRRAWFRRLQRRHRLHHFKDEHLWLGFTVPWVDDAFGTAPDPATVPTSPTVRTLGVTDAA